MNKKQKIMIGVLSSVVALAAIICVVVLLTRGTEETIAEAGSKYNSNYVGCTYPHDEAITLDGKLDEDVWQNKQWFYNTYLNNVNGSMPTIKVTSYIDQYGVYIASVVEDDNIISNGQRQPGKNSNWELYVTANNVGEVRATDKIYRNQYNIDMAGDVRSENPNVERGIVVDGEMNNGKSKGATLELFIPWQELDVDASENVPTEFGIFPCYRPVLPGQTETLWMPPLQRGYNATKDYYRFDVNGYMTADAENAVLGDNKFGAAKTGNWDISKESEGIVRSAYGTEHHKIFFKNEYDSDFIVETTMIPIQSLENNWPKSGIIFYGTDGNYYSLIMDIKENNWVKGKNGTTNVAELKMTTLDSPNGWNQVELSEFHRPNKKATTQEGIKLTVVKSGGSFWFFANGEFFTAKQVDFMDKDVFPGLYALGSDVIFKDNSCKTISDKELNEYLNARGIYTIKAKASSGGSVATSKVSVQKGETYDITMTSKSGYQVSSILINGKEYIADAKKKAVEGVYTVTGAKGNQEVEVKFEKVDQGKLTGTVKNDTKGIGADVVITGVSNGLLRYEISGSASKGYSAVLPNGKYNVYVSANEYRDEMKTVTVKGDTTLNFTMKPSAFAKTLELNGKTLSSRTAVWDLSKEYAGKVSTSYEAGGKTAPLYFNGTGKDFVATATINYTTQFTGSKDQYQPDLMGGFCVSNGTSTGFVVVNQAGITHTKWKRVQNIADTTMLTYPDKRPANFTIVKYGNEVNIYFDGQYAYTLDWATVAPEMVESDAIAVGLYSVMDKTADIEYSNFSVKFDSAAAKKYVSDHALKDSNIANSPFANVVTANGTKIKSRVKAWDLSNVAKNYVTASYGMGSKQQPLYFNKAATNFAVEATFDYITEFTGSKDQYQPDLMGGFAFNDGNKLNWIVAQGSGYKRTGWKGESNLIGYSALMYPSKTQVKFAVVKQGEMVYLYYNDALAKTAKWSTLMPDINTNTQMAIGLYMVADKTADIKASNYNLYTGDEAVAQYIESKKLKDGPVANGSVFAKAVTVNGVQLKTPTKNWDLSQAASNIAMGSFAMGTKTQPLYFNETGSSILIETTVEYTTEFTGSADQYQPDLLAGFTITDGVSSGFVMISKNDVVYTGWKRTNDKLSKEYLTYPNKQSVKLTLAVKDDVVYLYADGKFAMSYKMSLILPFYDAGSAYAFGLQMVADKTADARFSNTTITSDAATVANYINTHK